MKTAMRVVVLTLMLGALSSAQTVMGSGPGTPPADPPIAVL